MTDWTKMLRPESRIALLKNYKEQEPRKGTGREIDFFPVCKLFVPWGQGTFLLTECDAEGTAFGLADVGFPELGYIDLCELAEIKGPAGLRIEEDLHWYAKDTLSKYATKAKLLGRILA